MSYVKLQNPHIQDMEEDVLYHLGLGTKTHNLPEMFGDIKFVIMGGTPNRMENFAKFVMKEMKYKLPSGTCLEDISKHSQRYAMYKVGPVLSVSHGMGCPSLSILLHELIKLMYHAKAINPIFIRLGTSGGIGLEPGTVVVTSEALNAKLEPVYKLVILGKNVYRPSILDQTLVSELLQCGQETDIPVVQGKTICADDFYEGQGRLDGPFCFYTLSDKMKYLQNAHDKGVCNFEMESSCFAAITHAAAIKSAIVCVTILNRLNGDQVSIPKEITNDWIIRPQRIIVSYIKKTIKSF